MKGGAIGTKPGIGLRRESSNGDYGIVAYECRPGVWASSGFGATFLSPRFDLMCFVSVKCEIYGLFTARIPHFGSGRN